MLAVGSSSRRKTRPSLQTYFRCITCINVKKKRNEPSVVAHYYILAIWKAEIRGIMV
jgi:hypothetical protein